jgi:hypothetical protein
LTDESIDEPAKVDAMGGQWDGQDDNVRRSGRSRRAPTWTTELNI